MLNITAATVHSDAVNTAGYTGTGIGVAVIDSAISDMPEFGASQPRVVYQASFIGGSPADQYGHGTHVAGIVQAIGTAISLKNTYNIRVINLSLGRAPVPTT
jgi:subtilisin family serine protease